MHFDESLVIELRAVARLLRDDEAHYVQRLENLAEAFVGKESALEDIIYDFEEVTVRLEAMMVCKLMPSMDRLRIYRDLSLAEKDAELKKWAGILFRQEHINETAAAFFKEKRNA